MKAEIRPAVFVGQPRLRTPDNTEQLSQSKPRIYFLGIRGETDASSLHEMYGQEIVAGRIIRDHGITPRMRDTQLDLYHHGRLDTDEITTDIRNFVNESNDPKDKTIIAFSAPIFSWNYLFSVLRKLEQTPPEKKPTIVLGNAVATHTPPELIHNYFPDVIIVRGAGEETFSDIVGMVDRGEEVPKVITPPVADLADYSSPHRAFTQETREAGGFIKIRTSEGCEFGACKFCSRLRFGGKDFGIVPEQHVVAEVKDLLDNYEVNQFQLTDEDAFAGPVEATTRLISAWKSADLPRTPFSASLRVETILMLEEKDETILPQLREIGLQGVFLGVEGGSDDYLKQIGKGQSMQDVKKAIKIVKESVYTDPETHTKEPLNMEMGFITISPFMNWEMFVDNVRFASQVETDITGQTESDDITETYAKYMSALYNPEEIRAGTKNEGKLIGEQRNMLRLPSYPERANDPTHRDYEKYQMFRDYNPADNFNINTAAYENVPYVDPRVQEFKAKADPFFAADAALYYAVKSINRAHSLPSEIHEKARDFFLKMKQIHLQFLRDAAELEKIDNIPERRRALVTEMRKTFGTKEKGDSLDPIRREIETFLSQEKARKRIKDTQVGSVVIIRDEQERMLLVRPKGHDEWAFPGGNRKRFETRGMTGRRETKEEVGAPVKLGRKLHTFQTENHTDRTTGVRSLKLYQTEGEIKKPLGSYVTDGEIADTMWVSTTDILGDRIPVKKNVQEVAIFYQNESTQGQQTLVAKEALHN